METVYIILPLVKYIAIPLILISSIFASIYMFQYAVGMLKNNQGLASQIQLSLLARIGFFATTAMCGSLWLLLGTITTGTGDISQLRSAPILFGSFFLISLISGYSIVKGVEALKDWRRGILIFLWVVALLGSFSGAYFSYLLIGTIPFYLVYLGMFCSAIGWLYLFFFLIDQGMPSGSIMVPVWALPPDQKLIDRYSPIQYTLVWSLIHIVLPMAIGKFLIISAAGYYSVADVWLSVVLPGGLTHYPKAHIAGELAFIQATLVAIAWHFKNKRLDAAEQRLDAMEKQLRPSQHNTTIARNLRNAIRVIRKGQYIWMTIVGTLFYAINGIFTIPILPCYVPNLFPLLDPIGSVACQVISSIP